MIADLVGICGGYPTGIGANLFNRNYTTGGELQPNTIAGCVLANHQLQVAPFAKGCYIQYRLDNKVFSGNNAGGNCTLRCFRQRICHTIGLQNFQRLNAINCVICINRKRRVCCGAEFVIVSGQNLSTTDRNSPGFSCNFQLYGNIFTKMIADLVGICGGYPTGIGANLFNRNYTTGGELQPNTIAGCVLANHQLQVAPFAKGCYIQYHLNSKVFSGNNAGGNCTLRCLRQGIHCNRFCLNGRHRVHHTSQHSHDYDQSYDFGNTLFHFLFLLMIISRGLRLY